MLMLFAATRVGTVGPTFDQETVRFDASNIFWDGSVGTPVTVGPISTDPLYVVSRTIARRFYVTRQ